MLEPELGLKQNSQSEVSGPLGGHRKIFLLDFFQFFSERSLVFLYSQKFWPVMGLESLRFTQTVIKIEK